MLASPPRPPRRRLSRLLPYLVPCLALLARCGDTPASAAGVDAPNAPSAGAPLTFTVTTARRHDISPLVYGVNFAAEPRVWGGADTPAEATLSRMGGNRLSAYNWETNYSNAGNDYRFQNDQYLSESTEPGAAVRTRAEAAVKRGAAFLATVPMLPYVAGDACGCDVGTSALTREHRLAEHFKRNRPARPGAAGPPSAALDANDGEVYQDEFVAWLARTLPALGDTSGRLLVSLDNEPDIWHTTHREVQSDLAAVPPRERLLTYDEFVDTTVAFARAVKRVAPKAVVFGPALATYAGVTTLGRYPTDDPVYGSWKERPFLSVYLDRLRAAEATAGVRLLDVLDVHWYPAAATRRGEITNDYAEQDDADVEARLQAPRSLWDPTYDERSWVSGVTGGPVRLLPRLREQIATHYPGTKLAVTEYYYGRGGDISGGVAQADVLGIFGREGVYAAALWPQAGLWAKPYGGDGRKAYAYAFAAFRMYRNYDGRGARFGDTGVAATASDPAAASVYASLGPGGRVVLVAINKRASPQPVRVRVDHAAALRTARVFTLTAAAAEPRRAGDLAVPPGNAFDYTMPAHSVSTIELSP